MRIDYRYGAAVGILAAAFATLGPAAAQAGQTPGTLVPTCAGACGLEAPAVQFSGLASRSIVLSSTVERSSDSYAYGRERLAFTGLRDRVVVKRARCVEDRWGWGWHRACKFRHIDKFRDFKHVKHFNLYKHFNYFGNIHHGDFGGYGHVGLASHDSRVS